MSNTVPPSNNAALDVAAGTSVTPRWLDRLFRTKDGAIKTTYANIVAILRNDPEFATLQYNSRSMCPEWHGEELSEQHVSQIREFLELRYTVTPGHETVPALMHVARESSYDPVVSELNRLSWDGVARLDSLCARVLGNEGALESVMLVRAMIAAVARAREPGCQSDSQLVLYSKDQGLFKTSFWRILAGKHYRTSRLDITNKDAVLQMKAAWIYELQEIDEMTTGKDSRAVRSFLTTGTDDIRAPYERVVRRFPRSMIFVGSTNREDYLTDETGSRRFWTIAVERRVDIALLAEWRDQLWAEADHLYQQGVQWWLTDEEEVARKAQSRVYEERDAWEPIIEKWLALQHGPRDTTDILTGALSIEKGKISRWDQTRVGKAMRALGYTTERPRGDSGARKRVYVKAEVESEEPEVVFTPVSPGERSTPPVQAVQGESEEIGHDPPQQECGWSNRSNRSSQFPVDPHARAHAPTPSTLPISIGPVGPIGPSSQFAGENTSSSREGDTDHADHTPGPLPEPSSPPSIPDPAEIEDLHDDEP